MTPLCKVEVTLPRVLGSGEVRRGDRLIPGTIDHQCVEYDEQWQGVNHAFKPGGAADANSQSEATKWFVKHLPPTAK